MSGVYRNEGELSFLARSIWFCQHFANIMGDVQSAFEKLMNSIEKKNPSKRATLQWCQNWDDMEFKLRGSNCKSQNEIWPWRIYNCGGLSTEDRENTVAEVKELFMECWVMRLKLLSKEGETNWGRYLFKLRCGLHSYADTYREITNP